MSDHTNLPTCDWCLRPLAPEGVSWDDVDDPEGYCWGDEQQGCACASAHEEAWPKMLAEVARLRRDLRDSQNYRIEAAHDRGIEIERLRGLLGECAGWIGDTCDVIGMSDTRLNAARVLLSRLAAALEKDHG
jgi:hypothetical protein